MYKIKFEKSIIVKNILCATTFLINERKDGLKRSFKRGQSRHWLR